MVNLDMASWAVYILTVSPSPRSWPQLSQHTDFDGLLLHILGLLRTSSAREPRCLYPDKIPYHVCGLDLSCITVSALPNSIALV